MALATMDNLIAALAAAGTYPYYKPSLTTVAGAFYTTWLAAGSPGTGTTPSAAAVCTKATTGAINNIVDPGALANHFLRASLTGGAIATLFWFDRLCNIGGLNGTLTTAQTATLNLVTPAAGGRCNADGSDVEWFLDWYSATGSTAANATVTYLDQNAVSRTVVIALAATRPVAFLALILPVAGTYIKSIVSVRLSVSTGTAGNFGVTARKRFASFGIPVANGSVDKDAIALGAPKIPATSCLELVVISTGTASGIINGELRIGAA